MTTQKYCITVLTAIVLALGSFGLAHAVSLQNGGFETGDLTGWSTVIPSGGSISVIGSHTLRDTGGGGTVLPNERSLMARMKTNGPGSTTLLSQTFTATGDGVSSFVSFDYLFDSAEFDARSNDSSTVTLTSLGTGLMFSDTNDVAGLSHPEGDTGWLSQSVILNAGFDTYTLEFSINNSFGDGIVDSFLLADNVSVTAVPEPSTMLLFGSGLLGLAAWRRFKTNA